MGDYVKEANSCYARAEKAYDIRFFLAMIHALTNFVLQIENWAVEVVT